MNIYLIYQEDYSGYDTYDSAVVVAKTVEEAKKIHPSGRLYYVGDGLWTTILEEDNWIKPWGSIEWCDPKDVKVKLIGTTETEEEGSVICASYNAG